jgi:hypothetical protein
MNITEAENNFLEAYGHLQIIREKNNIDKERFLRGVIFAENIIQGFSANKAYQIAFQVNGEEARKYSSRFRNTKWVQELIKEMKPEEDTLYFGEVRAIIQRGMKIITNPESEDKDVTAAMNALAKYVKPPTKRDNEEHTINETAKLVGTLMEGVNTLVQNNKMVSGDGQIIDIPVLE